MFRLTRWFEVLTMADTGRKARGRYAARACRRQCFVALLAAGLLAGCGQSGPLTLPTRDVEATTPPPPAAEEQATEEERESEEDEE